MDPLEIEDNKVAKEYNLFEKLVEADSDSEEVKPLFTVNDCGTYIVEELGERQQIPARYNIYEGARCVLDALQTRYGRQYQEIYTELLQNHLRNRQGISPADRSLWRAWRASFEVTGTFMTPGVNGGRRAMVLGWNSGDEQRMAHIRHPTRSRRRSSCSYLAEGTEREYENRVDLANDSKPATDLLEEPSRRQRCAQRLWSPCWKSKRHAREQTPWEAEEYLAPSHQ